MKTLFLLALLQARQPPLVPTPWELSAGDCRIVYQTILDSNVCVFTHQTAPGGWTSFNVKPGERLFVSRDRCTVRVEPTALREDGRCIIAYENAKSGKKIAEIWRREMTDKEVRGFCRDLHASEQRFHLPLTDCDEMVKAKEVVGPDVHVTCAWKEGRSRCTVVKPERDPTPFWHRFAVNCAPCRADEVRGAMDPAREGEPESQAAWCGCCKREFVAAWINTEVTPYRWTCRAVDHAKGKP